MLIHKPRRSPQQQTCIHVPVLCRAREPTHTCSEEPCTMGTLITYVYPTRDTNTIRMQRTRSGCVPPRVNQLREEPAHVHGEDAVAVSHLGAGAT